MSAAFPACAASDADGNVGLAFGIVTAAGLSTTLGAALAFVMPYKRGSKNLFLAACLSIAAGVMIYVSFVEIFGFKAVTEFEKCSGERYAYLYASLCFFGGIVITYLFDIALHFFENLISKKKAKRASTKSALSTPTNSSPPDSASNSTIDAPRADPSVPYAQTHDVEANELTSQDHVQPQEPDEPIEILHDVGHDGHMVAGIYEEHGRDAKALIRMGIFAGIALGFHNFPEGLATFIAVLEEPSVGISVAIAIGIHNIPEGICVAMPIYYATGSRKKAFFWATLSGMTELLGALLGWAILRRVITPVVYGVLFGIVAGMMIYISFKELLPTAHRYDPEDKVTTYGLIFGMVVMAISLVLFKF